MGVTMARWESGAGGEGVHVGEDEVAGVVPAG